MSKRRVAHALAPWGYSLGGQAVGGAADMAAEYAPDLDLESYLDDAGRTLLEQAHADGGACLADGLALAVATELRDARCARGVPVAFREYPVDHLAGVYSGTTEGIAFVDSLVPGGAPPAPTC